MESMEVIHICVILTSLFFLALAWRTRSFSKGLDALENQLLDPKSLTPQSDAQWPRISLIVPACNEASTIESAAESLISLDYPNLEVIFVNDRSSDETGRMIDQIQARSDRFKAIHISELPSGWLGKVHAMSKGIEAATGAWIVLTDADVHFSAHALRKAVAYNRKNRLDFLTIIPDLVTQTFRLQVLMAQLYHQASLFFNPRKLNDPSHKVCYGQGAFLMFDRALYARSPGLEWLRMEVVDDTGFALMMRRAGARMGAVSGRNELRLEWYTSVGSMVKGLEKNGFAMCQYSLLTMVGFIIATWMIFLGFTVFPFLTKSWGYGLLSFLSLGTYLASIDFQLRKLMDLNRLSVCFFPITFVLLPFIFLRAGILANWRDGIHWRGTFYSLDDLRSNQRMKLVNLLIVPSPKTSPPQ